MEKLLLVQSHALVAKYVFVIIAILTLVTPIAMAAPPIANSHIVDYPLPDPLVMKDGNRVKSRADWPARRAEILRDMMRIQFGHMPAITPATRLESIRDTSNPNSQHCERKQAIFRTGPDQQITIQVDLVLPKQEHRPFPVIVNIGAGFPAIETTTQRGYAIALVDIQQLDPDVEGRDIVGPAQQAYAHLDWASIAVWAWGASRTLDFLHTRPEFDSEKTMVVGHSRAGKAALLAGAVDARFKMVVANGSGCGGAATYRNYDRGAETLGLLIRPDRFASWLHANMRKYIGREHQLPFDQHFLRALVAPRVVLSMDGHDDAWANPLGTQAGYQAAQPVFDLLGVPTHNLLSFRQGGHAFGEPDVAVLLAVAEWHWGSADLPPSVNRLFDPDYAPRISSRSDE